VAVRLYCPAHSKVLIVKKQVFVFMLGLCLIASLALAQAGGGGGGGGGRGGRGGGGPGGGGGGPGGGGPGGGRPDPAAVMEQLKTSLGATDEEWKVLQPKIEKINELRRSQMAGNFGGRGPGGGPGGQAGGGNANPPANESAVAKAARELREVLANQAATSDQIKAKLTALREARAKAREELVKAQEELKTLVTVKQEALLVTRGTLD